MKKLLLLCFLITITFTAKAQNLIPFESKGKNGFKDNTGKVVIEADYKYPDDFHDGVLTIKINNKYGGIDINGRIVVPFKYKSITNFYKGYAAVLLDNTVRIINVTGEEVKKLKYTRLGWSKDDIVNVGLNDKFGRIYIATGEEIIPLIYQSMLRFQYDFGFITNVQLNNKWGLIDKLGNVILPIEYDDVTGSFYNGWEATKDGKTFYFDKTGKAMTKLKK
jgi:hypothetical protein